LKSNPFELQGHRGARGLFAENTLAGFAGALSVGVHTIELDVAMTADDVLVVTHDPRLNMELTRGPEGRWLPAAGPAVRALRYDELCRYDVGRARPGSASAAAFPDQLAADGARVPTLAEVFALTAAAGVRVDVELKTDPSQPALTVEPAAMAQAVLAVAAGAKAMPRLAVRAFAWAGLVHLRQRWPQVPLTWLTDAETVADAALWWGRPGADAFAGSVARAVAAAAAAPATAAPTTWAPDHVGLTEAAIVEAHALGLRVIPWTVNTEAAMRRLIGWGVDGLCTDRPDLARPVLARAGLELPATWPAQPLA
jgi:glycerophosphoryl diester phosphodiesterase